MAVSSVEMLVDASAVRSAVDLAEKWAALSGPKLVADLVEQTAVALVGN